MAATYRAGEHSPSINGAVKGEKEFKIQDSRPTIQDSRLKI
jgi:hypothetical protein